MYGVCSFDNKQDRILTEYFEANDDMTIEKCLSICRSKGYLYSGLEWSCECHCGHAPEEGFEWAWSDKCDDRCAGDSNQICGGSEAISVWNTPPEKFSQRFFDNRVGGSDNRELWPYLQRKGYLKTDLEFLTQ